MSISCSAPLRRASSQIVGIALSLASLTIPFLPNTAHAQNAGSKAVAQLAPGASGPADVIALPPEWGQSTKPNDQDAAMARFAELGQQLAGASDFESLPPEILSVVRELQPNLNWLISQPDVFGEPNISALISGCVSYMVPAKLLLGHGTAGITNQSARMAKINANFIRHRQFLITTSIAALRCNAHQLSGGPGVFPVFPNDESRPTRLDGLRTIGRGLGAMVSGLINLSRFLSAEEQIFALTALDKDLGSLSVALTPEGRAIIDRSLANRLALPVTSDHREVRVLLAKLRTRFAQGQCALCQREGLPD